MTDRFHHLQSHQFIGEQLERPMAVPRRRFAQPHGNQLRFRRAVELGTRGWFLALLPVQCEVKPFRDETFADILDRLHPAVERLGDLDVQPSRPISIRLEQDLRTAKLLRRSREFLDNLLTDATLFI